MHYLVHIDKLIHVCGHHVMFVLKSFNINKIINVKMLLMQLNNNAYTVTQYKWVLVYSFRFIIVWTKMRKWQSHYWTLLRLAVFREAFEQWYGMSLADHKGSQKGWTLNSVCVVKLYNFCKKLRSAPSLYIESLPTFW